MITKVKKILVILLALVCVFSLCSCGEKAKKEESTKKEEKGEEKKVEKAGKWLVQKTVDEFGDEVEDGDTVVQATFTGKFSNSATNGSDLKATVFVLHNRYSNVGFVAAIRLEEYGDSPATYTSNEAKNLKLKCKVDDTVTEYDLESRQNNGDLYVGTEDMSGDADYIMANLARGKDVKCYIKIGNSEYNFTIEPDNMHEAFKEAWGRDDTETLPYLVDYEWISDKNSNEKLYFYSYDLGYYLVGDSFYAFAWEYSGDGMKLYMDVLNQHARVQVDIDEQAGTMKSESGATYTRGDKVK